MPGTGGVLPTPFAYFQMAVETIANFIENILEEIGKDIPYAMPPRFAGPLKFHGLDLKNRSPIHHLRDFANLGRG